MSSLLYIEVWKIRWKLPAHQKESFEAWSKSPMIFCLIWLLSYEGSISNAFIVWRNIVAGIAVIRVLMQRHKKSSGGSGCTLRIIVLFQRSWENKHPMLSNPFKLAVASLFWSSVMLDVIKSFETLTLLTKDNFWWCSSWRKTTSGDVASDEVLLFNLLLMTSSLQEHLTSESLFFRCFKLPFCWFHSS